MYEQFAKNHGCEGTCRSQNTSMHILGLIRFLKFIISGSIYLFIELQLVIDGDYASGLF